MVDNLECGGGLRNYPSAWITVGGLEEENGWQSPAREFTLAKRHPDHEEWGTHLTIGEGSWLRLVRNFVFVILLLYTGTVLPFRLCFIDFRIPLSQKLDESKTWFFIETVVDALFWADLLLNFFLRHKDRNGLEVVGLRATASKYFRTYFFIDLIACLPPQLVTALIKLFMSVDGNTTSLGRFSRLARLVRLARLMKLVSFLREAQVQNWMEYVPRGICVTNLILGLFWVVHLLACGWYLCAALHTDPVETWVGRRTVDFTSDTPLLDLPPGAQWVHAMYFVLVVFTTVGFGDISAVTMGEIVYVCFAMLVGAMVHGIIVSSMINVITSVDQAASKLAEQRELAADFAKHAELGAEPAKLLTKWAATTKVAAHIDDRERMRKLLISCSFPRELMVHLTSALFDGQLEKNNLFAVCWRRTDLLPPRLPLLLALSLTRRQFDVGDIVYQTHDHPWNMYLVVAGTFANVTNLCPSSGSTDYMKLKMPSCEMPNLMAVANGSNSNRSEKGKLIYQLFGKGSYFGDIELLEDKLVPRRSCVRCESKSGSVLVLAKDEFFRVAAEFPTCLDMWRAAARHRENHRLVLLSKVTRRMSYQGFAAAAIQAYWRASFGSAAGGRDSAGSRRQVIDETVPRKRMSVAVEESTKRGLLKSQVSESPVDTESLRQEMRTAHAELRSALDRIQSDVSQLLRQDKA